jgi:TldD protein
VSLHRRDFLKGTAAAAAASALGARALGALPAHVLPDADGGRILTNSIPGDPAIHELAMKALDAAKAAGASYADVRVGRYRSQFVATRERRVQGLADSETFGIGIRTLVNGAWGFAATRDLSAESVTNTARQAAAQAKANRAAQIRPITLAPVTPTPNGEWKSPIKVDPFTVPVADKVALLLAVNEAAMKAGARFVTSGMNFLREEKTFASTDGTYTVQTLYRSSPNVQVTAVSSDNSDFQSRSSAELAPRGLGYEHVTEADLVTNAQKWAEEAKQKLSAKPVEVGRYDLVLHPSNLWLTVHESVAHPTELDRALGFEANYAGTSFVAPPEKVIGRLKFGSELMTVRADRSQEGSLSRVAWDDEGVPPDEWTLIDKGIVKDYQTTREQAAWIEPLTGVKRSHGCSFAQSWSDVPFQRMPNVSLVPNTRDVSMDDIVANTQRGVMFTNRATYSIDHQRYNFQFGGQAAWEIRNGKVVGMVKDCAYQATTTNFWNSLDMLGGKSTYFLGGTFNDGKGEPGQSNQVSHGCPAARFRNINVIATGGAA